ncbi:hypothetical protein Tco_1260560 [Tanacetum coccineum]
MSSLSGEHGQSHYRPCLRVFLISSRPRIPTRSWNVAHRVQFTPYEDRDLWLRQMHALDLGAIVDASSSIPADYVSAGHVLIPADRDRIC